jgi:hypothetical protein
MEPVGYEASRKIRQCDATYPSGNCSSVDEPCNMYMCCREGRSRREEGEGREYCVKNTTGALADVISGLVVWHFQTQQETDISEIKIFHSDIQYKIISKYSQPQ